MRNCKFILAFCLVICLTACGSIVYEPKEALISQTKSHSDFKKGYSQFTDGIFGFCVTFPTTWSSATSRYWEATDQYNSSPDSDICIFIDGKEENYIRIYGQYGTIVISDANTYEITDFYTDSGLYGKMHQKEVNGKKKCQLLFESKHLAVLIRADVDCFVENEKEIISVLKSIFL